MTLIAIPQAIIAELTAQAQAEQPRECCGLLGGRGAQVKTRYPLRNQAAEPERQYAAAPEDLFEAMRLMRASREELLAIYHSHPRGPACPSATDLELAFYPQAVYLIIAREQQWEMRAFRLHGGAFVEIAIRVLPGA
jgi:proteasome lid subunit RPN8/RPN11